MQITLKQPEIEAALKLYIQSQGISLTDRDVDIKFTAGRKGAGMTADVDITGDPQPSIPTNSIQRGSNEEPPVALYSNPEPDTTAVVEDDVQEEEEEKSEGSLFN